MTRKWEERSSSQEEKDPETDKQATKKPDNRLKTFSSRSNLSELNDAGLEGLLQRTWGEKEKLNFSKHKKMSPPSSKHSGCLYGTTDKTQGD